MHIIIIIIITIILFPQSVELSLEKDWSTGSINK
jgi:hypothetical protein